MSLYVGRVDLGGSAKFARTRSTLSIDGDYQGASVAAAVQMRENLPWLEGTIQPVSWSEDASVDGFYRVRNVSAEHNETTLSTGWFGWSMDLEPLPHHRAIEVEATCRGASRTGAPVTGVPWYAVPPGYLALNYGHGSLTLDTREGPGGTATIITGSALYDRFVRWTIAPDDFYTMAPKVQFDGVTVVGLQASLDPFDAVLDNGLVKVRAKTGSHTLAVTVPASTNSSWGTEFDVDLGFWDGVSALTVFDPDELVACRILRNDAERCTIRYVRYNGGVQRTIDVSLRRGSVVAEIVISQESGYTNTKFGIQQAACTAVHSSNALRSGTTEGNYRFLLADQSPTQVTASGLMYATSAADQFRCGVGVILEAAGATSENDGLSVRDQFFAAQGVLERFSGVRT